MSSKLTKSQQKFLLENGFDLDSGNLKTQIESYLANNGDTEIASAKIKEKQIAKEDIFDYIYGVLHDPNYRLKYEANLTSEFPKIPFYEDFWHWAGVGKKLMDLHLGEIPLIKGSSEDLGIIKDSDTVVASTENKKLEPILKVKNGIIIVDENTKITDILPLAWGYKLGNKTAIDWVLEQYKPSKDDPNYDWETLKPQVLELLQKVIYISTQTQNLTYIKNT